MDHIHIGFPTCSALIGDFNDRCSKWWSNDITNDNGCALDPLTSSPGYKQIINKPTHTVNNFNIISNYVVGLSIFEKCHHNIIFRNINIRIPLPLSYVCEV